MGKLSYPMLLFAESGVDLPHWVRSFLIFRRCFKSPSWISVAKRWSWESSAFLLLVMLIK